MRSLRTDTTHPVIPAAAGGRGGDCTLLSRVLSLSSAHAMTADFIRGIIKSDDKSSILSISFDLPAFSRRWFPWNESLAV